MTEAAVIKQLIQTKGKSLCSLKERQKAQGFLEDPKSENGIQVKKRTEGTLKGKARHYSPAETVSLTAAWKHPHADKHSAKHAELCPAHAQHILASEEINSMMKLNTASTFQSADTHRHTPLRG